MANHPDGRALLRIDLNFPPIIEIGRDFIKCIKDVDRHGVITYISNQRIGSCWGNIIRSRWREFSKLAKQFYSHREFRLHQMNISHRYAALFDTFDPDGTPSTTCDGRVQRRNDTGESWSTMVGGDGTHSTTSIQNLSNGTLYSKTSTTYQRCYRYCTYFDLASLSGLLFQLQYSDFIGMGLNS